MFAWPQEMFILADLAFLCLNGCMYAQQQAKHSATEAWKSSPTGTSLGIMVSNGNHTRNYRRNIQVSDDFTQIAGVCYTETSRWLKSLWTLFSFSIVLAVTSNGGFLKMVEPQYSWMIYNEHVY